MPRTIIKLLLISFCLAAIDGRAETTVETIIASMSKRMADIDSIQLESIMRISFEGGEAADEVEQISRLSFRRPDHLLIDSDSVVLFSDAETITMAFSQFEYAIQKPIGESLASVLAEDEDVFGTVMFPDILALVGSDPEAVLQEAIEEFDITVLPDEEHKGRPAWVVRIHVEEDQIALPDGVRVWIDQETGLMAGLQATVDLSGAEGFAMMEDMPASYEVDYAVRILSLNEPLDDDLFAYDIEGYTLVNSMEELMEAFQSGSGAAHSETIEEGMEAPDFELVLMDDSTFRLSEHRDQVVLIDFWATWCPPCVRSLPSLQSMYEEFGGADVEFIGVSLDRPTARNQVEAMMERFELTYPIGINADGDIAAEYGAVSIPTLVVVDRKGIVRHVKVGFSEPAMEQVADIVRELVGDSE